MLKEQKMLRQAGKTRNLFLRCCEELISYLKERKKESMKERKKPK